MSILDNLKLFQKNKTDSNALVQETAVQSLPIYNARHNFIVLIRYNSSVWYEVLEFIEAAMRSSLRVIPSHDAEEVETSNENKKFESKKPVKFTNQRYYLLVSGSDEDYVELLSYLPLANTILSVLVKDIMANRSYVPYEKLIEYGVLDKSKFTYQDIVPKYEPQNATCSPDVKCTHDDIKLIMSKLPKCFSAMDIARVVNINIGTNDLVVSATEIIKMDQKTYKPYIDACILTLYSKIFKNPTYENIKKLALPIYFWEDSAVDPDGEFEPDKSMEDMDEAFQTQYERFNPIDESEFRRIDEKV